MVLAGAGVVFGEQAVCVNSAPNDMGALASAAKGLGLEFIEWNGNGDVPAGRVLIWEAYSTGIYTTFARARSIEQFVRNGGSLLLSLGRKPSICAFRLAPILPTTAYRSFWDREFFNQFPVKLVGVDTQYMGSACDIAGMSVPYFYKGISCIPPAERAIARYEQYGLKDVPLLKDEVFKRPQHLKRMNIKPGARWWTRGLWNRDWRIRARASDRQRTPLLITGRTGAGRVAVWNSTVKLADSTAARHLFASTLKWLLIPPRERVDAKAGDLHCTASVDRPNRRLIISVTNRSAGTVPLELVVRLMTWEQAPIKDLCAPISVAAGRTARHSWPLPAPTATSYQALDAEDAFFARIGVLTADGRKVLWRREQKVTLDSSPVSLSLRTADLNAAPHAFERASSPKTGGLSHRMGIHLDHYVFKPGQKVTARAIVSNGLQNLAPLARVSDKKDPGNYVYALNDGAEVNMGFTPTQAVQTNGFYTPGKNARVNPRRVETSLMFEFPRKLVYDRAFQR